MKKTNKKKKKLSAEEIAELADNGVNVSEHFSGDGKMKQPIRRVNVDFSASMLKELDLLAEELNISRQAVIKSYLRQSLDRHYIAKKAS